MSAACTELRADVRVIAATNVNLEERVSEGRFRADLFFRLNVVRIVVPPLREHPEDVPTLAAHFIARFNQEMKRQREGRLAAGHGDAQGLPLARATCASCATSSSARSSCTPAPTRSGPST